VGVFSSESSTSSITIFFLTGCATGAEDDNSLTATGFAVALELAPDGIVAGAESSSPSTSSITIFRRGLVAAADAATVAVLVGADTGLVGAVAAAAAIACATAADGADADGRTENEPGTPDGALTADEDEDEDEFATAAVAAADLAFVLATAVFGKAAAAAAAARCFSTVSISCSVALSPGVRRSAVARSCLAAAHLPSSRCATPRR
jgi:hypothetical protein